MKAIYLIYALSFAAAVTTGAGRSSAAPSAPTITDAPAPVACPATVYECCDGTLGTTCTSHGGRCGIISICGIPF